MLHHRYGFHGPGECLEIEQLLPLYAEHTIPKICLLQSDAARSGLPRLLMLSKPVIMPGSPHTRSFRRVSGMENCRMTLTSHRQDQARPHLTRRGDWGMACLRGGFVHPGKVWGNLGPSWPVTEELMQTEIENTWF